MTPDGARPTYAELERRLDRLERAMHTLARWLAEERTQARAGALADITLAETPSPPRDLRSGARTPSRAAS